MSIKGFVRVLGSGFLLGCALLGSGCGPTPAEKALEAGTLFEVKGQYKEAMAEYKRVNELDPKNTDGYYNQALLSQKQGDMKTALENFDKIIKINPNYSEPYYGRGQIYEAKGHSDKALAEYTQAIENNSQYAEAYYHRGLLYNYKREYRKALEDAEKAKILGFSVSADLLKELQSGASKQR